ncbi:MAG: 1-deoxy-D-xylulose-5-phosphate synthase [Lachnospiraceae bacterium]|nr:1-deoxy-D-xylulose-5-phosphate synthase [Lachnospiraceae bacterium]
MINTDFVLDSIQEMNDIKKVPKERWVELAEEIRAFLLENVSKTGGHLASNLGIVELTMALHLVLDFPKDKVVYDVGHQAYVHKILTGRKEEFATLRKLDGLCGFPRRDESPSDAFGVGHSSTSISAALGMAMARNIMGTDETIVAVIGDGALSGGMAYEALNNMSQLRQQKKNLIVILNDNNMSISENVGGMNTYLDKMRTANAYVDFKENLEKALVHIPGIGEGVAKTLKRTKDSIKQLFVPGMLFEDMGLTYVGPVDGHNVEELVDVITRAKNLKEPIVIHVRTQKGYGYGFAERYPSRFHGIDAFDIETGKSVKKKEVASYTDCFAKKLVKMAEKDERIVAITAAMPTGTGLNLFQKEFPDRFFDVGIAEEHAMTFAAGLASMGMRPVIALYSTFLQRAYDQLLHDVCLQNLPVTIAIDRSGIVGADGETHQGIYDISYLSSVPGLTIMAPKNRYELSAMMDYAVKFDGPVALKYPRGNAYYGMKEFHEPIRHGKSEFIKKGEKVAIIGVGSMMEQALDTCKILEEQGFTPTLVNARFIRPLDTEMLEELKKDHELIVTMEENIASGGYGSAVTYWAGQMKEPVRILPISLPDIYLEHGGVDQLKDRYGLTAEKMAERIIETLNN